MSVSDTQDRVRDRPASGPSLFLNMLVRIMSILKTVLDEINACSIESRTRHRGNIREEISYVVSTHSRAPSGSTRPGLKARSTETSTFDIERSHHLRHVRSCEPFLVSHGTTYQGGIPQSVLPLGAAPYETPSEGHLPNVAWPMLDATREPQRAQPSGGTQSWSNGKGYSHPRS